MDRNVNLKLNILMSSANKDDLREGFNASEPHIPRVSVCVQHKLLAERSVNQRRSFSPVIEAASVSGVERVSDTSARGAPVCFKLSSETPADDATGIRLRRCTSKKSFGNIL